MAAVKLTDLLKLDSKTVSYSFEVIPSIPFETINKVTTNPAFYAITWHARSYDFKSLDIAPLRLAEHLRSKGKNVLLHLSCDMLRKPYLDNVLCFLEEKGVCNLFVMLGEIYEEESSDFKNTKELIEYIRQTKRRYFCIGVAGFPGDSAEKLKLLKDKVKSGADFILTQAIFNSEAFITYVNKCKSQGITAPIMPGLFLYENHKELVNFTKLCNIKVPKEILDDSSKENEDGTEIVRKIIANVKQSDLKIHHFHFFTLNKMEKISKLVKEI